MYYCVLIRITLPDGKVKEGKKWNTSPFDVAKEISKSLASNAVISKVDGVPWDMNRPLEGDCKLELFTFEDDEGRDTFWHSSAHILGQVSFEFALCTSCCDFDSEIAMSFDVSVRFLLRFSGFGADVWVPVVYRAMYHKRGGELVFLVCLLNV